MNLIFAFVMALSLLGAASCSSSPSSTTSAGTGSATGTGTGTGTSSGTGTGTGSGTSSGTGTGTGSGTVSINGRKFDQVLIIVLENRDASAVLQDAYMKDLSQRGAYFTNYHGVTHPSYPNYLALTGGSTFGVTDDAQQDLNVSSIADLLEATNLTWAQYAEGYPGTSTTCFTGGSAGAYQRKHAPFLSYTPITSGPRCTQHITSASNLVYPLPNYSLYVPDMNNDGHDTSVAYSSNWLKGFLEPLLARPELAKTLVVVTFDESGSGTYPIYTVFLGAMVQAGKTDGTDYNHYNLLRTIEDNFQLGTLGRGDLTAAPIAAIWK